MRRLDTTYTGACRELFLHKDKFELGSRRYVHRLERGFRPNLLVCGHVGYFKRAGKRLLVAGGSCGPVNASLEQSAIKH